MSLLKSQTGRKIENSFHTYYNFMHDKGTKDKSKCKKCGIELSGKNSMNIIGHLERCHKQLFLELFCH